MWQGECLLQSLVCINGRSSHRLANSNVAINVTANIDAKAAAKAVATAATAAADAALVATLSVRMVLSDEAASMLVA